MTVPGSKSGTNRALLAAWPRVSVVAGTCSDDCDRLVARRGHWVFAVSKLSMVGKCMALGRFPVGAPWIWAMVGLQLVSCWRPRPFVPSRSPSMDQHDCVTPMGDGVRILESRGRGGLARRGISGALHPRDHGERSRSVKWHPANFSLPRCWWRLGRRMGSRCGAPKLQQARRTFG